MKKAVPHVVASPDLLIVVIPSDGNHRLAAILNEPLWQCKTTQPVTKT
jgi:hypothetical protein